MVGVLFTIMPIVVAPGVDLWSILGRSLSILLQRPAVRNKWSWDREVTLYAGVKKGGTAERHV